MPTDPNKTQKDNTDNFGLPTGEFKPIDSPTNKRWVKTTLIIAGISLLLGSGLVIWLLQNPSGTLQYLRNKVNEEKATAEAGKAIEIVADSLENIEEDTLFTDGPTSKPAPSSDNPVKVKAPTSGASSTLYYVVLGSFIDIDLATDYAKKLKEEGIETMIIPPNEKTYYARLVVETTSKQAATALLNDLKKKHAGSMWIMKGPASKKNSN